MRGRWRRRFIEYKPQIKCFKPCGVPFNELHVNVLLHDELEALRLADYEGLYQEECAQRMNISRTTFGRTIESARKKVTDCLLYGKALVIEEGGDTNESGNTNQ
ncbi:MAG: DUF134 domain-containing protein [Desulfurella sp.]|uniref:UPF0251 protein SAMN05660835_01433 n=1 Tax=Desulfurella multipotens TaxID=79269 RepID=A0A1G6PVI2_9BACT|nr:MULTISPECIES: DUF134 domain-containing protein [Desulfurella]AHF97086.1 hypothetical protein DESACE_05030 [Desulfurella acetivorans A63]HEX14149.1 DUF134 domain-containing protein [Desulfurella acetivorans]PMP67174.1 MAG: DUF134 domain-containing protein [Desulfurella multipotens]PMP88181.1 MAG: DUF134 domain-containing protein [Desulfurella sp.]SDC83407.1 Predicted DNA-binding protein, UPF0251 family [Desulfurella multipotens]